MNQIMQMPTIMVRQYDPVKKALSAKPEFQLRYGSDLEMFCLNKYGRVDSGAIRRYLADNSVLLSEVYSAFGFDPEKLRKTQIRALVTDDRLRPFFGPTTEEGFRLGIRAVEDQWAPLIGTSVDVDSLSVEWYELKDTRSAEDYTLRAIGQGAEIPVSTITVSGKSIILSKKGRGIQWTDESLSAPVSLVQMFLQVQGIRLGQSYYRLVADRLLNGYMDDGSDDPTVVNTATAGVITYADLLGARDVLEETNGYPATDVMASPARLTALRTMLWSASGGPVFPGGDIAGGLGVQVHRNSALPDDVVVFFNRQAALIRYVNKPFGTEDERTASRQITATYATLIDQVVPGMPDARVVLDSTWS